MDHTVPYGTVLSVDAFPLTSCQATIMLSLWDEIHLRAEALIKKALMGLKPWAEPFRDEEPSQTSLLRAL